jgi:uncharacterized protein YvpB
VSSLKKWIVGGIAFSVIFLNTDHTLAEKIAKVLPFYKNERTTILPRDIGIVEKESFLPSNKLLDVPLLNQFDAPYLKKGCEVTSLAMLLQYNGIMVTKNELAEKIPYVPIEYPDQRKGNPQIGFVGNMVEGPGLSVYNGPIFDLAKEYVGEKAVNLTGSPFEDLLRKVGRGIPVWVITTGNMSPGAEFQKWDTPQGPINITFSVHSVVITGYDQNYIYVNDPFGYKNRKVERQSFTDAWMEMGSQAIAIEN